MTSEVVGKVDVASRQVSEAVRLFFDQRDPIVIHTLIASAHQILFDLGRQSGVESAVKKIGKGQGSEVGSFLAAINYPFNFFKHADRDPKSEIDIGPLNRYTQDFIMDAIVMLQGINGAIPFEAKVFWHWFVSYYPEEFDNLPSDGMIATMQKQGLGRMAFHELSSFIKRAASNPTTPEDFDCNWRL